MRLQLLCIGKLKSGAEKDLAEDYGLRINQLARRAGIKGLDVQDFTESRAVSARERMADEASRLLAATPAGATQIVFDGRGAAMSSEAFAMLLQREAASGTSNLALLVGGPDGHGDEVRGRASRMVSLGAMTWPHRLVRVMVLEQVYRALTITLNHPYHRP